MRRLGVARAVWRRVLLKALALPVGLARHTAPRRAAWWPAAAALPAASRAEARAARGGRGLRIVVIRPDHLGDLLLATPALGLLRAALPDATITALVGPWARPALAGRPELDALHTCAFPGFTREPAGGPLAPYRQLAVEARRLRRGRYDVALVPRVDHWWGAALAAYAGIPLRLGYGVPASRAFLTHALPPDFAQHSVEESWRIVAALLGLLGRPLPSARPGPVVATASPAGQASAAHCLSDHGVVPGARLVAIHPGTGADVKLWPAAHWSAVSDALAQRLDARIVVTGSAAERELVAAVVGGMRGPAPDDAINAAGALDWDGLAGLFARCALVLGVDSGPLHLAAALGVPTVHVFGPTAPARFGPRGRGAHHVVRVPLPCSPCGNLIAPPCGARVEPPCMRAVMPEMVIDAALAAFAAAAEALPSQGAAAPVSQRQTVVSSLPAEPADRAAAPTTSPSGLAYEGGKSRGGRVGVPATPTWNGHP
jgi:ADP-heptose:LPS heptosyltransferase